MLLSILKRGHGQRPIAGTIDIVHVLKHSWQKSHDPVTSRVNKSLLYQNSDYPSCFIALNKSPTPSYLLGVFRCTSISTRKGDIQDLSME
jgi:hypothetical protein